MVQFSKEINAPIIYHDKPFKNGKGPSMDLLDKILDIENIIGLKEHVPDPLTLKKIYGRFGEKITCYDGFGKTVQFWSFQWGARGRHTCWAWFDPESDIKFVSSLQDGNFKDAVDIVNSEWEVANVICATGFQGYKYIMKLLGLPGGPVRIPGKKLNSEQKKLIENAVKESGLI